LWKSVWQVLPAFVSAAIQVADAAKWRDQIFGLFWPLQPTADA
jgi:hypothetical protein